MTSEKQEQKFPTDDDALPRSGNCFLLVVPCGKFDSTNQKHYPDLGSDASSVWNLCAHFSDVIWQGNQYMVVLPNVSCFLRLPNECRTQRLTRIDFQISFNPDGQIDDGFLKGQSWNEITMTLNIYSGSWIYIGYNIPLSHTDQETVTRVCHDFDSLTQ